jgi:hypothetical protein
MAKLASFWQFLPVFGNFQTRENFQNFHTREMIKHRKKGTQTMKITPKNTYQSDGRPKALIRRRSQVRILACPSSVSYRILRHETLSFCSVIFATAARNVRSSHPAQALSYLESYLNLIFQEA